MRCIVRSSRTGGGIHRKGRSIGKSNRAQIEACAEKGDTSKRVVVQAEACAGRHSRVKVEACAGRVMYMKE